MLSTKANPLLEQRMDWGSIWRNPSSCSNCIWSISKSFLLTPREELSTNLLQKRKEKERREKRWRVKRRGEERRGALGRFSDSVHVRGSLFGFPRSSSAQVSRVPVIKRWISVLRTKGEIHESLPSASPSLSTDWIPHKNQRSCQSFLRLLPQHLPTSLVV